MEPTLFPEEETRRPPLKPQLWNLWHGCHRKSEGCLHCYVFRRDEPNGLDTNDVHRTASFRLPIQRDRKGEYKIPSRTVIWTCFTSDFFLEEADPWRAEAWAMIRERSDLYFFMITKRPERIAACLPPDWGDGYPNVTICCTMENQRRADERLPIYKALPIAHKEIICEPLLEDIDFRGQLSDWCEEVTVGGESGRNARVCDYDWVLHIRQQCIDAGVPFHFKQTGAHFRKNGRLFEVDRKYQSSQARRADIDTH